VAPDRMAERQGWRVILLQHKSKDPVSRAGRHWITTDPAEISRHRGNWGYMAGEHFAVLDFDLPGALLDMAHALGALCSTVATGSGKTHCYVRWLPDLPRYFFWQGQKVGEIARLASEYVVCPPSVHPGTGRPYRWLADPCDPLPELSAEWLAHLQRPSVTKVNLQRGRPDALTFRLLRAARQQPGARQRSYGIKFQCPACRANGRDRNRDNAVVFTSGRYGCSVDEQHRGAVGLALGLTPVLQHLRACGAFRI
jgi:hypothetical protein